MVIKIRELVTHASTNSEGTKIYNEIDHSDNVSIIFDFEDIEYVTSSFLNSSLIPFLEVKGFPYFKSKVSFTNTNPQINKAINRVFKYHLES